MQEPYYASSFSQDYLAWRNELPDSRISSFLSSFMACSNEIIQYLSPNIQISSFKTILEMWKHVDVSLLGFGVFRVNHIRGIRAQFQLRMICNRT
jgi:hypothetical protein